MATIGADQSGGLMATPDDEEPEDRPAQPPTAEPVAARAQALTTLGYRADLERHRDRPDAQTMLDQAVTWCEHTGLRKRVRSA